MQISDEIDVSVVGGGLAGLAAATYLARGGLHVALFEKSTQLGGRARTDILKGYYFNMGAHASYLSGAAYAALSDLGITIEGASPPFAVTAYLDGRLYPVASGLASLLSSQLLSLRSKLAAIRLLSRIRRIDTRLLQRTSWSEWLQSNAKKEDLSNMIEMVFRLVTYSNDSNLASVGPAIEYFNKAYDKVLYINGGWQTLVAGLRARAQKAGVRVYTSEEVEAVEHDDQVKTIRLAGGQRIPTSAAILAVDPKTASKLVSNGGGAEGFEKWAHDSRPVRAATYEIGLSHLPKPENNYCLGLDKPLYFSVHSNWAKLSPEGGAAIHMVKYLGTALPSDPDRDRSELEEFLDALQPGWRRFLVTSRFLPEMITSTSLVEASKGGLQGRPSPKSKSIAHLGFAGDWVGQEGILADASLASAKVAAQSLIKSSSSSDRELSERELLTH